MSVRNAYDFHGFLIIANGDEPNVNLEAQVFERRVKALRKKSLSAQRQSVETRCPERIRSEQLDENRPRRKKQKRKNRPF